MQAPILIGELELTEPIVNIQLPEREDGRTYTAVHLLVRVRHVPVGYVFLAPADLGAEAIARQVWSELAVAINAQRERAGLPALRDLPMGGIRDAAQLRDESADSPLMTVVVCTRNRPDSVVVTLRGLVAQRYRPFEVVVVDNAPSSDATRDARASRVR